MKMWKERKMGRVPKKGYGYTISEREYENNALNQFSQISQ